MSAHCPVSVAVLHHFGGLAAIVAVGGWSGAAAMRPPLLFFFIVQGRKHNKFGGLSQDWVGGRIMFMCFLRSFLVERRTHKQQSPPPKKPGQSCETYVHMFFFLCWFFSQIGVRVCVSKDMYMHCWVDKLPPLWPFDRLEVALPKRS